MLKNLTLFFYCMLVGHEWVVDKEEKNLVHRHCEGCQMGDIGPII